MKHTSLILLMTFIFLQGVGQNTTGDIFRDEIDTLSTNGDSLFVQVKTFMNDTLIKDGNAFLIPDIIKVPCFRFTGNLFKKRIFVHKIIWEGRKQEYFYNGQSKVSYYKKGIVVSIACYNKNQRLIPESEFLLNQRNIRGPCGEIEAEYFVNCRKKKK